MSTFNGIVKEFPNIRIDYFRSDPDPAARPPLAYFLSHVHSDHLVGLETCKSPFIYCSPATRDILLRLEKYPHRMNFAKGILETRKQTYRHLKKLLKAIPLDTPTTIELSPGREIRVTLLDANHCVGAVMFLVEDDYKTILYTGDIRAERWWVELLKRNPVLVQYVSKATRGLRHKQLDCIYLDTTFVVGGDEDCFRQFPPKADGIQELIQTVSQYPKDTSFYIDAWTFGYEDVWQALSMILGSQIHVDQYRYGLYRALVKGTEPKAPEAVKLMGFQCGNHFQPGCLSSSQCRLHSCEKGTGCTNWDREFVRITPIISRHNGREMAELGAGGGQGDLSVKHELEVCDPNIVCQLMELSASKLQGQKELLTGVLGVLTLGTKYGTTSLGLDDFNLLFAKEASRLLEEDDGDTDEVPLDRLVPALAKLAEKAKAQSSNKTLNGKTLDDVTHRTPLTARRAFQASMSLPKQITFPYSRHSSYEELCMLVEAFQPLDIYPCTVDEANWSTACSMKTLFGHLYRVDPLMFFSHDESMKTKRRPYMPVEDDLPRPMSASSSTASLDGTTAISGVRGARSQGANMASKEALAESTRLLNGRPWSSFPERPIQAATDEGSWLARLSSRRNGDANRTTSHKKAASTIRSQEGDQVRHRMVHTTATRLEDPSPTLGARSQPEPAPTSSLMEEIRALVDGRKLETSHDALKSLGRLMPYALEGAVPESGPPTPAPRKRVKLDPLAFRNEITDAILGRNGLEWADIELVSVHGHQEKEVEL